MKEIMHSVVLKIAVSLVTLLQPSAALQLNITALGATNDASTLECWQTDTPFSISAQQGTVGSAQLQLGNTSTITYIVVPAQFDGGVHNAPANQLGMGVKMQPLVAADNVWVVFLSGLAYITLPADNTTSVYVSGGQFGLIFAADTADVSGSGHSTSYPGTTEAVTLEIPTFNGEVPAHTVLHPGPCTAEDTVGLLALASGSS